MPHHRKMGLDLNPDGVLLLSNVHVPMHLYGSFLASDVNESSL